jgi:hypothetical protein
LKYLISFCLLFIFSLHLFAITKHSPLCMENEAVIFSFTTNDKKTMSLCKAKNNSYIIYRYGTKDKIELEYPKNKNSSWSKFKYSYYNKQGGSSENEGMDLNYFKFKNKDQTYTIYHEYYTSGNETNCGIIIDEDNNNSITIEGEPESIIGTLIDFRSNGKVEIVDDF